MDCLVKDGLVLEGAKFIVERATNVKVDEGMIAKIANNIIDDMREKNYSPSKWRAHDLHPKEQSEETLNCFWSDNENVPYEVVWDGRKYQGYWSLCACINRA